ncbi:hypothetical protein KJ763_01050 [Patescibacteria group bacterium]|nr:hypothetical protein [Patescibacteria group bacterium]
MLAKIKNFSKAYEKDLIIILIIFLVALISFGLGRLSKLQENKAPISIENMVGNTGLLDSNKPVLSPETAQNEAFLSNDEGLLVGSKNGTKYHYPWCSGALRIKEENKVWFNSVEEARQAGYTPAANCKGLK